MLDEIIEDMFNQNWTGKDTLSSIENMRKQLTALGEKFIEDFELLKG